MINSETDNYPWAKYTKWRVKLPNREHIWRNIVGARYETRHSPPHGGTRLGATESTRLGATESSSLAATVVYTSNCGYTFFYPHNSFFLGGENLGSLGSLRKIGSIYSRGWAGVNRETKQKQRGPSDTVRQPYSRSKYLTTTRNARCRMHVWHRHQP